MSQEHEKTSLDGAEVPEGIHSEPSPFEPGYQPDSLPRISVPDLPDDAEGLSAEALAQVPTLTELVEPETVASEVPALLEPDSTVLDVQVSPEAADEVAAAEPEAIQDVPTQADTWGEVLHARMGKLTDDIHTLNVRLDRLEQRNKTKV